jgi:hypothetical protein
MKSKLIVASLLAAASFSAFAGSQSVEVISGGASKTFLSENNTGGLFSSPGGMDQITFDGLESGSYKFLLQLIGSNVNFDFSQTNLNGKKASIGINDDEFSYFVVKGTKPSPLTLNLFGSATGTGVPSYTGTISVSAVPEPETYGMLMAGLGMLGFMARRKAVKKSV